MANVLIVSARELRYPVLLVVLVKAHDSLVHQRFKRWVTGTAADVIDQMSFDA